MKSLSWENRRRGATKHRKKRKESAPCLKERVRPPFKDSLFHSFSPRSLSLPRFSSLDSPTRLVADTHKRSRSFFGAKHDNYRQLSTVFFCFFYVGGEGGKREGGALFSQACRSLRVSRRPVRPSCQ